VLYKCRALVAAGRPANSDQRLGPAAGQRPRRPEPNLGRRSAAGRSNLHTGTGEPETGTADQTSIQKHGAVKLINVR
jgi:hypothetical protein